jgi:hypothetical protein
MLVCGDPGLDGEHECEIPGATPKVTTPTRGSSSNACAKADNKFRTVSHRQRQPIVA